MNPCIPLSYYSVTSRSAEKDPGAKYCLHHPRQGAEQDAEISDVKADNMGSRTKKGQFVLKDLEDEVDAILASTKNKPQEKESADSEAGLLGSATSKLSGLFRNVVGGKKLTKQDLQQPFRYSPTSLRLAPTSPLLRLSNPGMSPGFLTINAIN